MGMFVRQSLLNALGLNGGKEAIDKLPAGPDAKKLAGELRRLHGELKAFVAESLSDSFTASIEIATPSDSLGNDELAYGFLPPGSAAIEGGDVEQTMSEFETARDELEQIAQRAFSISPRLGAMESFTEENELEKPELKDVRDPLDELLEDPLMNRIDKYLSMSKLDGAKNESTYDDEPDDEIFDVPLPSTDKPTRQAANSGDGKLQTRRETADPTPPSPQPPRPSQVPPSTGNGPAQGGLSGGPPPRRRQ